MFLRQNARRSMLKNSYDNFIFSTFLIKKFERLSTHEVHCMSILELRDSQLLILFWSTFSYYPLHHYRVENATVIATLSPES